MFLLQLFTVFTTTLVHLLHPTPSNKHVLAAAVTPMPTVTPVVILSATPTVGAPAQTTNYQILIDCVGPDGKHLHTTQKSCNDFNNAWQNAKTIATVPTSPYGQATKIADHTYELKLPPDSTMATSQEVFTALNNFRQENGVGALAWNATLANYAQSRANYYTNSQGLDAHAGFMNFINNQNGFTQLGFNHLGENASYAGPLNATHLIQWVFAADAEHNNNQLNKDWTTVGVGINNIATDIIFASSLR